MKKDALDLLLVLNALVLKDAALPLFSGRIAVGIAFEDADSVWWNADFSSSSIETSFADDAHECDAAVYMSCAEANAILDEGRVPSEPQTLAVGGDRTLLRKFLERYVIKQSAVALRSMIASRDASKG